MANSGMTALGIAGIGAGALFVYSAFTKKPLFGPDGMVRAFITTGSVESVGASMAKVMKEAQSIAEQFSPSAVETRRPLNNKPPGA